VRESHIDPRIMSDYFKKIIGYPIIFFILYAPIILIRVCEFVTNGYFDWPVQVTAGLPALNGFGNAIYFGYSWGIIGRLRKSLCLNENEHDTLISTLPFV